MKIYLLIYLLFSFSFIKAQSLPTNEQGKISFFNIQKVPDLQKEDLYHNGYTFISGLDMCEIVEDSSLHSITARCGIWVYKTGIIRSIDGIVKYDLQLEVKDEKYRCFASNFIYQQYKRNRYSRYEPVKDSRKNLEDDQFPGKQKQWEGHKDNVNQKMQQFLMVLDQRMKIKPPDESLSQEIW